MTKDNDLNIILLRVTQQSAGNVCTNPNICVNKSKQLQLHIRGISRFIYTEDTLPKGISVQVPEISDRRNGELYPNKNYFGYPNFLVRVFG